MGIWATSLHDQIWVFDQRWFKDASFFAEIQKANWDDVILDDKFKDGLRRDTKTFFASKPAYASLGITWKRGILLLGPPGNGKTESIKALLKEAPYPALYVKSFTTQRVRLFTLTDRTTMLTLTNRGLKLGSEASSLTHARKPLASWSLRFVTFLLCATRLLKRPRISMLWSRQTCAASS